MPIRIYALAKELGIANKDLVDYCERLGIQAKSALTGLSDVEVVRVRQFFDADDEALSPSSMDVPSAAADVAPPTSATSAKVDHRRKASDSAYAPSAAPMSLSSALAIDSLHAQVAELGAVVESLILRILDTSETSAAFPGESSFCELIDNAIGAGVFASLSANDLHSARMARNRIVHRRDDDFPGARELRQSRNAFVLAILDLLEYCGEPLKAEVLCEFKQYFPENKRRG